MASADVEFRCFVGGLHYRNDENDLERAFSKFGDVIDSKIVCNPVTGKSRNFGFITFKDEKSMRDAIEGMNGRKLDGSRVDPKDVKFECFVGCLADGTKETDLVRAFSLFGQVIDSEIAYDTETGKSRRFGFVSFKDEESMRDAIVEMEIDEMELDGRKLDATRIICANENNFWDVIVNKSNRIYHVDRALTVKEAWPHKPGSAEMRVKFLKAFEKLIETKKKKSAM